jgi:hypothetical protein
LAEASEAAKETVVAVESKSRFPSGMTNKG